MSEELKIYGLGEIELNVEKETETEAVYVIEGEDHTIGNLLEKMLLTIEGVEFASYEVPHPLENRIVVKITTNGEITPREAVIRALREALKLIDSFERDYIDSLKAVGKSIEG